MSSANDERTSGQHPGFATVAAVVFAALALIGKDLAGLLLIGVGVAVTLVIVRLLAGAKIKDLQLIVGISAAVVLGGLFLLALKDGAAKNTSAGDSGQRPVSTSTVPASPTPALTSESTETPTPSPSRTASPTPTPQRRVVESDTIYGYERSSGTFFDELTISAGEIEIDDVIPYLVFKAGVNSECPRRYRRVVAGDRFRVQAGHRRYVVDVDSADYVRNTLTLTVHRQRLRAPVSVRCEKRN